MVFKNGELLRWYHKWINFDGEETQERIYFSTFSNQRRQYPSANAGESHSPPGEIFEFKELDMIIQEYGDQGDAALNVRIYKQNAINWEYLIVADLVVTGPNFHYDKLDFRSRIDRTINPEDRIYPSDVEEWDPEDWIIEIERVDGELISGTFQATICVRVH